LQNSEASLWRPF